ncbi:MAG: hypothetical protein LIO54_08375 [Oscillospiraceae bacterium]|nr:hypothetical protein [Oscillospiraceae bacterium]
MKNQINEILKRIGSRYSTDDGKTLVSHIGGLVFLRRSFESEAECLAFVQRAAAYAERSES